MTTGILIGIILGLWIEDQFKIWDNLKAWVKSFVGNKDE